MQKDLSLDEHKKVREYFMQYVRKVVPKALIIAVLSGIYLISINFGEISSGGLSNFQIVLGVKAFLGAWLGLRGIIQVFFGIQPLVFKSHIFPFTLVIIIIFLSQINGLVKFRSCGYNFNRNSNLFFNFFYKCFSFFS